VLRNTLLERSMDGSLEEAITHMSATGGGKFPSEQRGQQAIGEL
jgi:hypothetical protein